MNWTPPVNKEFERYGNAFFISATPYLMPRWLVHADPRSVVAGSPGVYILAQLFRPTLHVLAAVATWCLRKTWTAAVERRNIAGAAEWRAVLREEFSSRREAYARRDQLVSEWSDDFYAGRPFVD